MLGLAVEIALNWLILRIFYQKDLSVLGLVPTKGRLIDLPAGFMLAAACCVVYFSSFTFLAGSQWSLNESLSGKALAKASWWTLQSVLFEEFIFRGALLYVAIQKFGVRTACILSAVAFGTYHWFSMGVFGNAVPMLVIFGMTGIWGFMLAAAFAGTKSLYLPIGIHFGWNWVSTVVFSQGPLGNQLFIHQKGRQLEGVLSLLVFLFQVFAVPGLVYLYLLRRRAIKPYSENSFSTDSD